MSRLHSKSRCFADAFAKSQKKTVGFVMSPSSSSWNNLSPTGRIFMKLYISVFFEYLSRIFNFHYNLTRITITLHVTNIYVFLITRISRAILLRLGNISDNILIRSNKMPQMQVFICCKITLHVSGVYHTHHQEYIKL